MHYKQHLKPNLRQYLSSPQPNQLAIVMVQKSLLSPAVTVTQLAVTTHSLQKDKPKAGELNQRSLALARSSSERRYPFSIVIAFVYCFNNQQLLFTALRSYFDFSILQCHVRSFLIQLSYFLAFSLLCPRNALFVIQRSTHSNTHPNNLQLYCLEFTLHG